MKALITIWILFSLTVFAQSDCNDFKILLKEVDKNYSELSQNPFPSYIKFTLTQKDNLKTSLYNIKGELVYQNNFDLLGEGIFIVKYFNPKCPGVYFVSTEIGNQPAFKKAIQITSESFPTKEIETEANNTIIDGVWERSYSEKFIPAIQIDSDLNKIEYRYKYDLKLQFSKGVYKIISVRTDEDNSGREITTFNGRFIVKGDSLKLYEDSKLKKILHYEIIEDTLSISYFPTKDKVTGTVSIPTEMNVPYNKEIKLIGNYHK